MAFSFKIDIVKDKKQNLYGYILNVKIPNKENHCVTEQPKHTNVKAFSLATSTLQKYLNSNLIPF